MSNKANRIRSAAAKVAQALETEGRKFEAQQIKTLIRSSIHCAKTAESLWHENQDLRNSNVT